jgi:hypothetical protein
VRLKRFAPYLFEDFNPEERSDPKPKANSNNSITFNVNMENYENVNNNIFNNNVNSFNTKIESSKIVNINDNNSNEIIDNDFVNSQSKREKEKEKEKEKTKKKEIQINSEKIIKKNNNVVRNKEKENNNNGDNKKINLDARNSVNNNNARYSCDNCGIYIHPKVYLFI